MVLFMAGNILVDSDQDCLSRLFSYHTKTEYLYCQSQMKSRQITTWWQHSATLRTEYVDLKQDFLWQSVLKCTFLFSWKGLQSLPTYLHISSLWESLVLNAQMVNGVHWYKQAVNMFTGFFCSTSSSFKCFAMYSMLWRTNMPKQNDVIFQ